MSIELFSCYSQSRQISNFTFKYFPMGNTPQCLYLTLHHGAGMIGSNIYLTKDSSPRFFIIEQANVSSSYKSWNATMGAGTCRYSCWRFSSSISKIHGMGTWWGTANVKSTQKVLQYYPCTVWILFLLEAARVFFSDIWFSYSRECSTQAPKFEFTSHSFPLPTPSRLV